MKIENDSKSENLCDVVETANVAIAAAAAAAVAVYIFFFCNLFAELPNGMSFAINLFFI